MLLKLFVFIGLFVLCSSGLALKMTENIEVDGYGEISAQTDQDSVYDRLDSYGDNQAYSRKLTSGDYEQAKLETTYTYRNSKNIKNVNVSGRYEAGLRMPDGVQHSIWVKSNTSINTTSTMSYVNGDLVVGSTNFYWDALNANLSEDIKDFSLSKTEFIASTDISGNFSLVNELTESQRMSCTAGVLLEMLDAAEMRGFNQVEEVQSKGPRTIIIDGKIAPADVQASYLQKDAYDLIIVAVGEKDDIKRRGDLTAALELIDRSLEIYPNDAIGLMNKGTALDYLNRTPEAIDAYEKAIRLDGTNSEIIFTLGELLFENKQWEKSIHYLTMGLNINPDRKNGWYWLAQAYYSLGKWDEAEAAIDKHLARNRDNSTSMLFKAIIQYQNQSYQEAVESYENVLGGLNLSKIDESERDEYAMYFVKLGMAYSEIGKPEKAKEKLNVAKLLFTSLEDKDKADEKIQNLDQNPAGSSPAETPQTESSENLTSLSNLTRPVNGLGSALM